MPIRKWVYTSTHSLTSHEPMASGRCFTEWGARRRAAGMNRYMGVGYWIAVYDPQCRMRSMGAWLRERKRRGVGDKGEAKNIPVYREWK